MVWALSSIDRESQTNCSFLTDRGLSYFTLGLWSTWMRRHFFDVVIVEYKGFSFHGTRGADHFLCLQNSRVVHSYSVICRSLQHKQFDKLYIFSSWQVDFSGSCRGANKFFSEFWNFSVVFFQIPPQKWQSIILHSARLAFVITWQIQMKNTLKSGDLLLYSVGYVNALAR